MNSVSQSAITYKNIKQNIPFQVKRHNSKKIASLKHNITNELSPSKKIRYKNTEKQNKTENPQTSEKKKF